MGEYPRKQALSDGAVRGPVFAESRDFRPRNRPTKNRKMGHFPYGCIPSGPVGPVFCQGRERWLLGPRYRGYDKGLAVAPNFFWPVARPPPRRPFFPTIRFRIGVNPNPQSKQNETDMGGSIEETLRGLINPPPNADPELAKTFVLRNLHRNRQWFIAHPNAKTYRRTLTPAELAEINHPPGSEWAGTLALQRGNGLDNLLSDKAGERCTPADNI